MPTIEAPSAWARLIDDARARVAEAAPLETRGTLTRLTGLVLEAVGIRVPVDLKKLAEPSEAASS